MKKKKYIILNKIYKEKDAVYGGNMSGAAARTGTVKKKRI